MAKRNWPEYNKKLVNKVIDVFVDSELLLGQKGQLMKINDGKNGRPYSYSDTLILIMLAVKEHFGLPYRQTEGFAKMLGGIWGSSIPSYTQICRRQKKLNVPLGANYRDGPVDIAVDSTGIKVFNRGELMRQEWAVKRGWIKVHISCDISNHTITSVEATDQYTSDGSEFRPAVDGASDAVKGIGRGFAGSGYDYRDNFNHTSSIDRS